MARTPDPALLAWLSNHHIATTELIDRSWDHAESMVFELNDHILKTFPSKRKFDQEYSFYKNYSRHLKNIPQMLLAHDSNPFAILISRAPGDLVQNLEPSTTIYHQAGQWLRQLHQTPCHYVDNMPLGQAYHLRTENWLQRAQKHCDAETLSWASSLCIELNALDQEQRVLCHRDYTPRNWLWHNNDLHIIDFEMSRPDWWLTDCERLISGAFRENPSLGKAFFDGYGRLPTKSELQILYPIIILAAISTIVWAIEHNDEAFKQDGLARLSYFREQGQINIDFIEP